MNQFTDEAFLREHASYLCNVKPGLPPIHGRPGTCRVCAGPLNPGYSICRQCEDVEAIVATSHKPFPISWLAFLTYAVEGADLVGRIVPNQVKDSREREGRQAYLVLKGYKAHGSVTRWYSTVAAWTMWFLQRWGTSVHEHKWLWATVPSVRSGRQGEHPLHAIVSAILGTQMEIVLSATDKVEGRLFNPLMFACNAIPEGASILLIDDSWTSGSNLLSAAATLREAGASMVNAMVLGRLLNPSTWSPTRDFVDHSGLHLDFGDGLRPGFDPARSPWTRVG